MIVETGHFALALALALALMQVVLPFWGARARDAQLMATARPLALILPQLKAAAAEGLLEISSEKIAPTLKGRRFLNVLLERMLERE